MLFNFVMFKALKGIKLLSEKIHLVQLKKKKNSQK